ncbi:MAG TPA: TolC family protein [Longimicrobiales bacterium]|nr:TolC family protein [Longimicrobiales bacterium]
MVRTIAVWLLALAVTAAESRGQQPLTIQDVYTQLRNANPQLHAARALAEATALRESSARLPADPNVRFGVMNLSLPGLAADMPNSMAPAVQLMQMVPFPGKLGLAGQIAQKSTVATQFKAEETWWELRAQAAMAFYDLYSVDRQLAVMKETLALLQDFQGVAKAMYAAGQGRQSDVLRANVETAKMQADILRMQTMRKVSAARLNGLLNRPADTPLPAVELGIMAAAPPARDTLRAWAEAARPMLAGARTLVEQTALQRSLARKELWPDFTLGLEYGQRPAEMGTERMGSVMLGFSVPIFASRRQLRMRAEGAAMETMARAELADMRARVDAKIAELIASIERCSGLIELYRTDILPQADANVKSAFSAYRVGSVDFMTLLDAQMTVNQYRQELHALVAEHGGHLAELEMTVGRELPVAVALRVEVQS